MGERREKKERNPSCAVKKGGSPGERKKEVPTGSSLEEKGIKKEGRN